MSYYIIPDKEYLILDKYCRKDRNYTMIPFYENGTNTFRLIRRANMVFPAHLHSHLELIYVEEGVANITIGSQSRELKKGDFAISFPNRIHSYNKTNHLPPNRLLIMLFPMDMAGDYMSILLKQYPINPFIERKELHSDIGYAFQSLLTTPKSDTNVIKAYLQLMLARVLPHLTLKSVKDNQPPGRTASLVSYLSDNFCEPITLDHLSTILGISRYSVSRIFSEKLHTSFSSYINSLRINHAQNLLQRTDQDILTISLNCGYENSRTFNREFKKICGCSPREYRKKNLIIEKDTNK